MIQIRSFFFSSSFPLFSFKPINNSSSLLINYTSRAKIPRNILAKVKLDGFDKKLGSLSKDVNIGGGGGGKCCGIAGNTVWRVNVVNGAHGVRFTERGEPRRRKLLCEMKYGSPLATQPPRGNV